MQRAQLRRPQHLFASYMNGFLLAKTKQMKDIYFSGALTIVDYGTAHGCTVKL